MVNIIIEALEEENKWYKKENKKLEEENRKLKEENRMLKEERIFSLGEWDYMILTSTTPQLKLTKKDNSDLYSNITIGTTQK